MSVFIDEDGNAISRSFVQPTASVDAEPVAWLYEHPEAKPLLRHSRFPMSVPGWTETPLYTEAQMQARADAARREARGKQERKSTRSRTLWHKLGQRLLNSRRTPMQDDLKERLQLIAELSGRLTSSDVASIAKQAADHIAALEAKLAEKDALLRECGEALERARNAIGLAIDQLPTCYAQGVCGHEIEIVRTTLAKIKDATDAD